MKHAVITIAALLFATGCETGPVSNDSLANESAGADEPTAVEGGNMMLPGTDAPASDAAGTRPAGPAPLVEVSGVIGEGVECRTLQGDDGTTYSISGDTEQFADGTRVRVTGEIADASFCMQGQTLMVESIDSDT